MRRVLSAIATKLREVPPHWVLIAAWLVAIVYAFPGYMNWDACNQDMQARSGVYGDGHPPLMAWWWHVLEYAMRGPFLMLLVQTTTFLWGLYALLRLRFSARTSAWVAAALFLFPPILTPMSAVGRTRRWPARCSQA